MDTVQSNSDGLPYKNAAVTEQMIGQQASISEAAIFLKRMGVIQLDAMPAALQTRARDIFLKYGDIREETHPDGSPLSLEELRDAAHTNVNLISIQEAVQQSQDSSLPFLHNTAVSRLQAVVRAQSPIPFPYEAEFTTEELPTTFPKALELQSLLGSDLKFKFHIHTTGNFYIVENAEGKKMILRIIGSNRSIEDISRDLVNSPHGLPHMQAHSFSDGSIGVFADWIDGHQPISVQDYEACKHAADSLLVIPVEKTHPKTNYDFNDTNFIIPTEDSADTQQRAYYVDHDLIEVLIQQGLSRDVPEERIQMLETSRKQLDKVPSDFEKFFQ